MDTVPQQTRRHSRFIASAVLLVWLSVPTGAKAAQSESSQPAKVIYVSTGDNQWSPAQRQVQAGAPESKFLSIPAKPEA